MYSEVGPQDDQSLFLKARHFSWNLEDARHLLMSPIVVIYLVYRVNYYYVDKDKLSVR
jgi:hypothetical protein